MYPQYDYETLQGLRNGQLVDCKYKLMKVGISAFNKNFLLCAKLKTHMKLGINMLNEIFL